MKKMVDARTESNEAKILNAVAQSIYDDAARYRWLRAQLPKMDGLWIAHGIVGCLSCWNGQEADEAIDSAMKEKPL